MIWEQTNQGGGKSQSSEEPRWLDGEEGRSAVNDGQGGLLSKVLVWHRS